MGLECRRQVRISTEFGLDLKTELQDDMWANAITYLLAKVINFCFEETEDESLSSRVLTWTSLVASVTTWKDQRPATFNSFSTAPKAGNVFPSIWLVRPWHGIYLSFACSLPSLTRSPSRWRAVLLYCTNTLGFVRATAF